MTRESKIALLVGLGFIICFGAILSEARTDKVAEAPAAASVPMDPGVLGRAAELEPLAVLQPREPAFTPPVFELAPAAAPAEMTHSAVLEPAPMASVAEVRPRSMGPYTVVPGDSLSKIAAKVYGHGGRREYMRIFEANRDTLRSVADVRVGQKLRIPPPPAAAGDGANRRVREMDGEEVRRYLADLGRRQGASRAAAPAGRAYVVRRGDTLTAIARRVMGDGSVRGVRRLYRANRDVIVDPNRLAIGATLTIPR